ncbi:MAG: hypothetical protein J3K34DRAFT_524335 [Monoraphidium minutum]|nr:MAG: hypothetical protein J3K34DRAFT_524335 [Monoraphidium minutum]
METQMHYDLQGKQLSFRVRENITADPDLEARLRGLLNTVTGEIVYRGTLKKYYSSGPLLKGEGGEPLRLGGGVGVASSTSDAPFVTLSARKRIALVEGRGAPLLTAKARVDLQPASGQLSRRVGVRVSRRFLNFTQRQDLEVAAGLDVDWPTAARSAAGGGGGGGARGRVLGGGKPTAAPYLSVRENNWGLHLRRGQWSLTYDL